jgi:hypothetical protein
VQRPSALTVIVAYGLKFLALFEQPFNIPAVVRELLKNMKNAALNNGHFTIL